MHPGEEEDGVSVAHHHRVIVAILSDAERNHEGSASVGDGPMGEPTLADLRARRAELLQIAAARGAQSVRVFGSVARGEARADSDVDFLVELEPGRTVLDLSELILDFEAAIGRAVDVVTIRRSSPIAERIRREAIPL
jgi:uncharacterized protein